ncbi:MAG TPA: RNA polymerase sigma factor [Polyangiaceae bacterium]|jgi:RNA polymerase sigma-70 factor (ECF subfamily)|nr:RNA polymerase sigma factor [Polyangiaceae bacterium]
MPDSPSTGVLNAGSVSVGREMPEGTALLDRAMDRYADGDDSAFAALFSGLGPRLVAFLKRMGAAQEQAHDLAQETFMRMHQARGHFARGKSVVPWAYAIARNCYISHARSPKARMARNALDADEIEIAGGQEGNAESSNIARQMAETVQRALDAMTPARREAFVLLRYEGLSVEAAAQVLGTTEGAVKVRAFHAYEAIRIALKEGETPKPTETVSR